MSSRGCKSSSKTKTEQDHGIARRKGVGEGRTGSWGYSKMIINKVLL